jgi:hypothetical protein
MSELKSDETVQESQNHGNVALQIFLDPYRAFNSLLIKPSFIFVTLLVALSVMILSAAIIETVGFDEIIAEQINNSPQLANLPNEQRKEIIQTQSVPIMKYVAISAGGFATLAMLLIGGLYYWFSMSALGGKVRFPHGVAVFSYSSLPPTVLLVLSNLVVLAVKPADEVVALAGKGRGLIQANFSILLGADASPALRAFLESVDLFALLGWVLAVIGIRVVGKVSLATSIGIVALGGLFGIALRVTIAAMFG